MDSSNNLRLLRLSSVGRLEEVKINQVQKEIIINKLNKSLEQLRSNEVYVRLKESHLTYESNYPDDTFNERVFGFPYNHKLFIRNYLRTIDSYRYYEVVNVLVEGGKYFSKVDNFTIYLKAKLKDGVIVDLDFDNSFTKSRLSLPISDLLRCII